MADIGQAFQAVVDKKPLDYSKHFDELLRDKITQLVADRKIELAYDLFGAPEGLEQPEEIETPTEGDENNGKESEEDNQE